jgi:hypothetical protein
VVITCIGRLKAYPNETSRDTTILRFFDEKLSRYAGALAHPSGAFDQGIHGFAAWSAAHFMRLTGLTHVLDAIQGKAVKSVLMVRAQLSRAGAAGGHTAVVVAVLATGKGVIAPQRSCALYDPAEA